ncbi:MAG: signal peptide peptidase SppA [Desulfobacterales bacterium]|nr:signal peptide peptidase SppA [Desulfobacterales bacterium]
MFSRRHPILFFILVFSAIAGATLAALTITLSVALRGDDISFTDVHKVGIIEIEGVILDARTVLEDLKRFREEDSVRAIVLRIDSPGGVVGPAQEIYREVRKTRDEKTVIASMGSIAASGGYYVAAAAEGVMANPGTITGSIGVIIEYTNFKSLLDKIGLVPVVIKSGEYKDLASPVKPMSEEEREILQTFADQTHTQFIRAVAQGRGMDDGAVARLADGRIFNGEQARELGLVDRLGNLQDAVDWAAELAGIEGDVKTVYSRTEKYSLLGLLTEGAAAFLSRHLKATDLFAGYLYKP